MLNRRMLCLVGTFLFSVCPLTAAKQPDLTRAQEPRIFSGSFFNGRWWKQVDRDTRETYLRGFEDGVAALSMSARVYFGDKGMPTELTDSVSRLAITTSIRNLSWDDFEAQIDQFYRDAANVNIPVAQAFVFSLMKSKGESQQSLDDFLVWLRKNYNQ